MNFVFSIVYVGAIILILEKWINDTFTKYICIHKFDKYKLKMPLIKVAGTAFKYQVDLISIMVS